MRPARHAPGLGLRSLAALALLAGCAGKDAGPGPSSDGGAADGGPGRDASPAGDAARPGDAGPGADARIVVPTVPPTVDGLVTINELMAGNGLTVVLPGGASPDWVELHNPTAVEIPLEGYSLTSDLARPGLARLPQGLALAPGGYLVLYLDDQPQLGSDHIGLTLPESGATLALARPDGSFIDRVSYAAQSTDFSAARTPDDSDHWSIEWHVSPGAGNPAGPGLAMGLDDAAAPPEAIPAAGDLSDLILGYDVMPRLELLVSPAAAAALELAPRTYVGASIVFDGRSYGPVGLRLKGQNSFQPFSQKPSLRINVDLYRPSARFFGLKDLTLNNMDNDYSMMHERLAYKVAREAGLPASRANHVLLTVNGQFYGLYTGVETVKKTMLTRLFADASGPLYEATDVDFVASYLPQFEHESGPDDRSLLAGLMSALTVPGADDALAIAAQYANLDEFRLYWAMCSVIGQFDSFPYSNPGDDYFVYADPTTQRLHFLPWGMDETFYSSSFDLRRIRSVLAQQCMASPACFQDYVNQVWDVFQDTERMGLAAERTRVAAQIAPWVALDTRKPYTTAEVLSYQDGVAYFVQNRRAILTQQLGAPTRSPRP